MIRANSSWRARAEGLLAVTAVLALTALPAWADDPILAPQSTAPLHPDASAPAHRMKLEVPPSLAGDQKLSIELGYGGTQPLDPTARLPNGPWGRTDLRAVKAGLSFGF